MTKRLYVSSAVQAVVLREILIPEMASGFWKDHRPADHARQWEDVEIVVSSTGALGPVEFVVPRLYNFVNVEFVRPNEGRLIEVGRSVKPSSTLRSIKKELLELSHIIGGRLTDKNGVLTKAYRGNNRAGPVQQPAARVRPTVKKAVVNPSVTLTTSNGATVRRVPVTHAQPVEADLASSGA